MPRKAAARASNPRVWRMQTVAVVLEQPERLVLSRLDLDAPGEDDVVVDIDFSGISTGTERLLWSGRMPPFPGMGYPLVPGYELVGRVISASGTSGVRVGQHVFVPGARCYGPVRGLFGGAASRVVVPANRITPVGEELGEHGVLLALAATAFHAIGGNHTPPDLIVGHGVLGRLLARLTVALGAEPPVVWENNVGRTGGADGYAVVAPEDDPRRDYAVICDVSGDAKLTDTLIGRLRPKGEIVLAGFYSEPISFDFPPAFMKEARLRIAAEWQPSDLAAVKTLIGDGRLPLAGLISHREPAEDAAGAYRTAFNEASCLKMILDWRSLA